MSLIKLLYTRKNKRSFEMKYLRVLLLFLLVAGCAQPYDDSSIQLELHQLDSRVSQLEELCRQINNNLFSLQRLTESLDARDYVTGFSALKQNGVEIGYDIRFASGSSIQLYHGKDGHSPVLGIKQYSDGKWYWTLDGTWITDGNGRMMSVSGTDGTTPQLKIVDGYWYVSMDNGKTWAMAGQATGDPGTDGDSFFKSVTETEEAIVLVLSDGTTIQIPKRKKLTINFETGNSVGVLAGETRAIAYTIQNGTTANLVKAFGQNGWSAKVRPSTHEKGYIDVHAPDEILGEDAEVIVLVYDGEETTIMKTLSFEEGVIQSDVTGLTANGAGQQFSVSVGSNLEVSAHSSASWVTCRLSPATKTVVDYSLNINVSKNLTENERAATITVSDPTGKLIHSIAVVQGVYDRLDDYTDLSEGGETANCYLINGTGSYRFPIIKGNGSKGVIISGDTAEITDATDAKIVWQDADIVSSVGVYKGHLVFETTSTWKKGNAVIAVTDSNGEILWSWHIWSTDYVLGSNDVQVYNHAKTRLYKMMAYTLGETSGKAPFYQFGRKDPFPGRSAEKVGTAASLESSIKQPDTFFGSSGYDWCTSSRTDWWDAGCKSYHSSTTTASVLKGNKTIYDPCPAGYRVPPDDAFTSFTKTGQNTNSESEINSPNPGMISFLQNNNTYYFYTQIGSNTIPFRAFGGLNATSGAYLTNIAYYYAACPSAYSTSRLLQFYAGGVKPMQPIYSRALGGTIRPIRDEIESDEVYESSDYSKDGTTLTIQQHTVGKGIKILIVGDGFTDKDINSGRYDQCMSQAADYFFDIEPYASFRDRFDVINMRIVSQTSVFDEEKRTAFKGTFEGGTRISGDLSTAYNKAFAAFGTIQDVLIIVVMNTTRYAGTCYMAGSQVSVAFCPMSTQTYYPFNTVIHHEAGGHGFANLGDEYFYSGTIPSSEASDLQSVSATYGWYQNLDVTSDRNAVKWSQFLYDPDYMPNTSVYEGGYSYTYGVWRPTYESCMNSMYGNFNAPSRLAIHRRIMQRSGEDWSWAAFKSYDKKKLSMTFNGHDAPSLSFEDRPRSCPPVSVPLDSLPKELLN